jgi:general stress protein 26
VEKTEEKRGEYMTETKEREMCLQLMEIAKSVILTTIGSEGYPETRAMLNLRNKKQFPKAAPFFAESDNEFMVLFSTNTSSPKMKDVESNKAVSVYYCDQEEMPWRGVMLGGEIEIITDMNLKRELWQEGWEIYYPEGGPDDPDYTVLRVLPKFAKGWNQNHTFYFKIGDDA